MRQINQASAPTSSSGENSSAASPANTAHNNRAVSSSGSSTATGSTMNTTSSTTARAATPASHAPPCCASVTGAPSTSMVTWPIESARPALMPSASSALSSTTVTRNTMNHFSARIMWTLLRGFGRGRAR